LIIVRIIGYIFAILAISAASYEAWQAAADTSWRILSLGELWYKLDSQSLSVSQAGIQRYVTPWLWEPVITAILRMPAWVVFGAPGLLFLWVSRKSVGRKRRRRSTGI